MTETTDLIIRRAKALLATVDTRTKDHSKLVKANKRGNGRHAGDGPVLSDFNSQFLSLRAAIDDHEGNGGHSPIPFEREIRKDPSGSDTIERHESYGLLSFSRTHGGHGRKSLFGSHVETHPTTICLEIRRAERRFSNELSYDSYNQREHLIEVEMSNAQFADAITLMNHGTGIPCSIRHVGMATMEPVPSDHRTEQHEILAGFRTKMKDVRKRAEGLTAKLSGILGKKSIGKGDRESIGLLFERLIRSQSDNAAFTLDQFNEAAQKLETAAKREVEAYTQSLVVAAGFESLQTAAKPIVTQAITDGENDT